LSGIASGVGIGVIRAISTSVSMLCMTSRNAAYGTLQGLWLHATGQWERSPSFLLAHGMSSLPGAIETYAEPMRREICQRNLRQERARVQQVMETFPKRFVKPAEAASQDSSQPTSA
jgi:hypothetical protein